MNHVAPSLLKVEKHYKDAKEIQCLETGVVVEIDENTKYTSMMNEIFVLKNLIWCNGKYAKIIS